MSIELRCKFCNAEPSAKVELVRDGGFACRNLGDCIARQHEREELRRQGVLFDVEADARARAAGERRRRVLGKDAA